MTIKEGIVRLLEFHMSTGAWIFATGIGVAAIASTGVYAAANSIVAIGNPAGSTTALVTPARRLQTVMTAANNVVHVLAQTPGGCSVVYTPPAGKAIVVTQVTYDLGSGVNGDQDSDMLTDASCNAFYDIGDTAQPYETQSRTYPSGLPMPSIGAYSGRSHADSIAVTGYLIPATQLPAEPTRNVGRIREMMSSR